MTNPNTKLLLALTVVAGCAKTPPPELTYDFSERAVTDASHTPIAASSPKAQLRRALEKLQPELARCTASTTGTIDLTLRIAVDADEPAALEHVAVTYPETAAAECVRQAIGRIDLSHVTAGESAIWVVHAPFVVAARS